MKKMVPIIIISFFCTILPVLSDAASVAESIEEGNRLYEQGKYDDAVKAYQRAKEDSPDSDIANFNLGAALYKKGRYQEAVDVFIKALNTEDRKMEADAIYNIANAGYKLGSRQVEKDPRGAVDLYRQSVDYYKRALELDQENDDARYNLEIVQRELKELQEKLKDQPEKQQQDKKDDKKGKEQESQAKQNEKKQGSEEKRDEGQGRAGEDGNEQRDQQQKAEERNNGEEQESGQYRKEDSGMTPEEARMLLDAFGEEGSIQDLKMRQGEGHYPRVLKDW